MLSCNCKIVWTSTLKLMMRWLMICWEDFWKFIKDFYSSLGKCNHPTSILPLVQFQAINERIDQWLGVNKDYYVVVIFPYDTSW